jgi:predicted DNA-binding transcriptional regulator YafY
MSAQAKLQKLLEILMMLNCKYGRTLQEICNEFDISERTTYRYIETIRNVGFLVDKRESQGKIYYSINKEESIHRDISDLLHFSKEEAYILSRAIHSIDQENELKNNLIKKLYSLYDFDRVAVPVIRKENSHKIHQLANGINRKKQVVLERYQSSHSNTISDRLIEPLGFTTNFVSVWGFDTGDLKNKIFKTSRIRDVEMKDQDWQYEDKHQIGFVDVFRISSYQRIPVKLEMSLLAKNLLTEEYPLSEKYIVEKKNNRYVFETEVASLHGVGRFVLSLIDEVKILWPPELRDFVMKKIESFNDGF